MIKDAVSERSYAHSFPDEVAKKDLGSASKDKIFAHLTRVFAGVPEIQLETSSREEQVEPDELLEKVKKVIQIKLIETYLSHKDKRPPAQKEKDRFGLQMALSLTEYCEDFYEADDVHGANLDEELGKLFNVQLEKTKEIIEKLDTLMSKDNSTDLDAMLVELTSLWFKMLGGEVKTQSDNTTAITGDFDSFILMEKLSWWSELKKHLTEKSAIDESWLFLQTWEKSRDTALDLELAKQLGSDKALQRMFFDGLLAPLKLKHLTGGSDRQRGERKLARLLKKLEKTSKKHQDLQSILSQEVPTTTRLRQWEQKAKELKVKTPQELKRTLATLKEIETFSVTKNKLKKLERQLNILYLFAMAVPGTAALLTRAEQYAWQAVSLIPPEARTAAFTSLIEMFDSDLRVVDPEDQDAQLSADWRNGNSLYPEEMQDDLENLYSISNPEYQTIDEIFNEAVDTYEAYGNDRNSVYWRPHYDAVTYEDIIASNYTISSDYPEVYSPETLRMYQLSGDPFTSIKDVSEFLSIVHGQEFSDQETQWYLQDYYNFTFAEYTKTGEGVQIGTLLGFALERNNGDLAMSMWDIAIFTKLLTRNGSFTLDVTNSDTYSGYAASELLTEPFNLGYTTENIIDVVGMDGQFWNVGPSEGGFKDFDPANMIGVDYHILFTLAWADRMPISLLSGGVLNEMLNFATQGEYGTHKIEEQLHYFIDNLGSYRSIIHFASETQQQPYEPRSIAIISLSSFNDLLNNNPPAEISPIEQILRSGQVVSFSDNGVTRFAILRGSDIQPYVVIADTAESLAMPLSSTELLTAESFQGSVLNPSQAGVSLPIENVFVDLEQLPQELAFHLIENALGNYLGSSGHVNEEHIQYLKNNADEFVLYINEGAGMSNISNEVIVFLITEIPDSLSREDILEIVKVNTSLVLDNYSLIESKVSIAEVVTTLFTVLEGHEVTEEQDVSSQLLTFITRYPEVFAPHFSELEAMEFPNGLIEESLRSDLLHYGANLIARDFSIWSEVFTEQELVTFCIENNNYDVIASYPEVFSAYVDGPLFEALLMHEPNSVLYYFDNGWSDRYTTIDPVEGVLQDLERLNPTNYLEIVATNITLFESKLIAETSEGLQPTELAVDVLLNSPGAFIFKVDIEAEGTQIRQVFTPEWMWTQAHTSQEFLREVSGYPELFATTLSNEQVVMVLEADPFSFLYSYEFGWNSIITELQIKEILMENEEYIAVINNPEVLAGVMTSEELSIIITTDLDLEDFLSTYLEGWDQVIPKESLLEFVQEESANFEVSSSDSEKSWAYFVLLYPSIFEQELNDVHFLQQLLALDQEAFLDFADGTAEYVVEETILTEFVNSIEDEVLRAEISQLIEKKSSSMDNAPFSLD